MAGFPPASGSGTKNPPPKPDVKPSTGPNDLKTSIAKKDAAIKVTPGVEKSVSSF